MSVRRLDPVQPSEFAFSPQNMAWAKKTIAQYPSGKQASAVIALLWRAQEQSGGWLPKPAMERVAELLGMSYIRVLEVATFYTMFQLSPVGRKAHIQVCGTTPCMLRGAEDLKKVCQHRIHPEPHHVSADGDFSWEEVECLGACVNAPMVQIWKDTYEDLTPATLETIIDRIAADQPVKAGPQIDRQFSAPQGGPTTLTDPSLYNANRTFLRMEPPPPAPAAAPPIAAPAAAPAAAAATVAPMAAAAPPAKPAAAEIVQPAEPLKRVEPPPVSTVQLSQTAAKPVAESASGEQVTTARPAGSVRAASTGEQAVKSPLGIRKQPVTAAKPARAASSGPVLLKKPKGGKADNLKLIWGVGPSLERMLNTMGIYHFEQIAAWSASDLKWVDERLEGFKGRARRDEWIKQSKKLATGWRPDNSVGARPKGRG
jgi:NADH-quinone oxidoreductase subunit E